jgi:hypothetical protein
MMALSIPGSQLAFFHSFSKRQGMVLFHTMVNSGNTKRRKAKEAPSSGI